MRGVRQLRLREEPRRGVRPDRVRVELPQAVLPGPVRGRADQRPADGLLPGRGADQRREAPRRGGPAGRREPERLRGRRPSGWGGPAGRWRGPRATTGRTTAIPASRCRTGCGIDERPRAGALVRVRDPGRGGAGPLGGGVDDRLGRPAGAAPRQGDRRGAEGAARRGARPRPVHEPRRRRRADRAVRGGRGAADPGRGRWTRSAGRGASSCGSCARSPGRRRGGSTAGPAAAKGIDAGPPGGRWTSACRRPRRRRCPPLTEPERLGDAYAVVGLDARRQAVCAVPGRARPAGGGAQRGARRPAAGPGAHRRARRHPPAPDDRARDGVPRARGRDRDGQRHALAGHVAAAPVDGPAARAAPRRGRPPARGATSSTSSRARRPAARRGGRTTSAARRHRPASGRWGTPGCAGWASAPSGQPVSG